MLVLTRKRGERIVIPGCEVTITVANIKGDRVRLGIAAPAEVAVLREELVRRKKHGSVAGDKSLNPADHD
jgi:carbon storage regulator